MSKSDVVDQQAEQLLKIRHSTAHVMAEAVMEMFPGTKIAIGPAIEEGFYYDFDLPEPLKAEDLERIEKRMRQIMAGKHAFSRRVVSPFCLGGRRSCGG